jgi:carbon-monoxide dehydrogenase medium subunit
MGRVLQPFEYFEPTSLQEAQDLVAGDGAKFISGGCELVLSMRRGAVRPQRIVSLSKVEGLDGFSCHPKIGLEAGAQVTLRTLANDIWVAKRWAALHEAIDQLHPPHIANMGTVIGNLCCATPYYDIPTALLALRAELTLEGPAGERKLPLGAFYLAPGKTAVKPQEVVTKLTTPPPDADGASAFRKIYRTQRRHDDLHKINAAAYVVLDTDKDVVTDATVVIGSWDFRPVRSEKAEKALAGAPATTDSYVNAAEIAVREMKLLTDIAWVEQVRAQHARVLVRDVLEQAASRARSKYDPAEDLGTIDE